MKDFSILDPERTRKMEDIDRKINEVFGGGEGFDYNPPINHK
jgi:hypothetical protein